MATFSSLYRKRKALAASKMERWFPPSEHRDIYLTLLHLPENSPKIPDSVLRTALLRRAMDVIQKAIQIRQGKGPLQNLLQRGSVGDDTWAQFLQAEQAVDAEIKEIAEEAMSLSPPGQPPWAQFIFQTAAEMIQNDRLRKKLDEQKLKSEEWGKWWSEKQEKVRTEFLKSEGLEDHTTGTSPNPATTLAASTTTATVVPITPEKAKVQNSSDEDGVLVDVSETPEKPAAKPVSTPQGSVRNKKKNRK